MVTSCYTGTLRDFLKTIPCIHLLRNRLPVTDTYCAFVKESGQRSRYSDQAAGWTGRGLDPAGARDLSLRRNVKTGSGSHPASSSFSWWRVASFQGVKRLGSMSNHSPARSAEIRISGVVLPRPIYFRACIETVLYLCAFVNNSL